MAGETADYRQLLTDGTPLIDLRSPSEFAAGAFPHAVNLPLLLDEERAKVGTTYKEHGQAAAIEVGLKLVSGDVRAQRIARWIRHIEERKGSVVYCWRGGLRSEIVQTWLQEAGHAASRVTGGFKALRQFCLSTLDVRVRKTSWMVLAGRAGSGKTYVIQDVARHIDLEALANHRGSAFGGLGPQPPPIAFENALAAACLSIPGDAPVVLEDESRTIGRLAIPPALYGAMQFAPIVLLEVDQPTRIDHILDEYVERAEHPRDALLAALDRIRRRLGGLRHQQIQELMNEAFLQRDGQCARNDHREWIRLLLDGYYDPMYDYQVAQKEARIVHRGDAESVKRFLLDATGS